MRELHQIKALFFGESKEIVGTSCGIIDLPAECTVRQLLDSIFDKFPKLLPLRGSLLLALDRKLIDLSDYTALYHLTSSSELAVLPPFSGG
ncbi:hypothetical protein PHET_10919 [Paragonimus heterotremus]|uniref:Molybdopterin synthase sulfur carrier subunit n=1 Tax=Paragonimus heterotremus TaxID=100268 RepID=A0A8J4STV9_9TREM|nr:hypothetical protein PHET_10919 [Paragonimus heterotremus]